MMFCVTAVYLVAQYARYEMRRMEAVTQFSCLILQHYALNQSPHCHSVVARSSHVS